jgi:peroxiredoxin
MVAGNEKNRSLIRTAQGKAVFTYERVVDFSNWDGDPSEKQIHQSRFGEGGIERRQVTWWVSRDWRRADEKTIDIPEGKRHYSDVPTSRKAAWSPEQYIYLEDFSGKIPPEAYVNNPRLEGLKFVRAVCSYFDPMLFFTVNDWSLGDLVKELRKAGHTVSISQEGPLGHEVYTIIAELLPGADLKPGLVGHSRRLEIQIDAGQGYNVTKVRGELPDDLAFEFDAAYTDGGTEGAVFFPEYYRLFVPWFKGVSELVEVALSDVVVNGPVDQEVFTFKGMGVQPGTRLVDLRHGEPAISHYGEKAAVAAEVGKPAPELVLEERAGVTLERFRLHGRVLLPDGRPAAGAAVLLKTHSYYEGKAWSLQEKQATNATGSYDFGVQDVPRDSKGRGVATYLYVLADGFGLTGTCLYFGEDPGFRNPFAFVVTGEDVTHDISVSAEAACSGTVVGPDGKPLVGATVRLDGIRPADGAGLLYVLPGIIGTETDAAGRFSLSGLPAGARWRCMVEKEGHVRVAADLAESEKNRVALSLAGTVEGVVVYGDTGRPAANVRLRVQCELAEPPGEGVSFHDIPSATSDDDGRFRITPLPGGQGALQLAVPSGLKDWTAEAVVGLAIQPGKTTSGVVLTLIHGGVLSGRVLDARTGSPVSGATVWVTRTDGRRWPTYENPMTDAQGRYSIRLPANEYQVQFSYAKGYVGAGVMRGTERCAVTVRDGQETQAPDLKAEPGSDVSVKVLMPDGKPAVGIDVMLEGRGNHSPYPERTSPAGEVLFLAQPPGQTMQVRARNGDATLVGTVTITPKLGEANEAVVTLERIEPCSVVGRIVDEAGKPVAGAKVFCRCLSESGQRTVGSGGVSGADGRFEVKGLEAEARLFLDFQAGGYGQATPKPFSLSRGETHDAGTIVLLTTDQEIAGKVVDLDGKPVAHASVKGLALASGHSSYGTTGSDGTFRLKNFPNDTIRINALLEQPPPGSATVPRTAATVRVGTTDVQLVLPFRQASLPEASVSVGRQAPELVLEKGADVTLAQFKGKPVVVAFVSIYSRPCVKVLDDLKALQAEKGADTLGVIAVHDRTATPEEIEQFRKDHGIPFPVVRVPDAPRDGWDGETFRAYGVTALPTVVHIDVQGKVASIGDGSSIPKGVPDLLGQ